MYSGGLEEELLLPYCLPLMLFLRCCLIFVIRTEAERNEWLSAINDAIKKLQERTSVEKGVLAPLWHPDANASTCSKCRKTVFSLMNRRHHCRNCGHVVCDNCSSKRLMVQHVDSKRQVRVCDSCYSFLTKRPPVQQISPDDKTAGDGGGGTGGGISNTTMVNHRAMEGAAADESDDSGSEEDKEEEVDWPTERRQQSVTEDELFDFNEFVETNNEESIKEALGVGDKPANSSPSVQHKVIMQKKSDQSSSTAATSDNTPAVSSTTTTNAAAAAAACAQPRAGVVHRASLLGDMLRGAASNAVESGASFMSSARSRLRAVPSSSIYLSSSSSSSPLAAVSSSSSSSSGVIRLPPSSGASDSERNTAEVNASSTLVAGTVDVVAASSPHGSSAPAAAAASSNTTTDSSGSSSLPPPKPPKPQRTPTQRRLNIILSPAIMEESLSADGALNGFNTATDTDDTRNGDKAK
jgi:hypothetical protein